MSALRRQEATSGGPSGQISDQMAAGNRIGQAVGVTAASQGRRRMQRSAAVSWKSVGPTDTLVPVLEDAFAIGDKAAANLLVIGAVRTDIYAGRKVPIDAVYTPSATQMGYARSILVALDQSAGNGHGAAVFEGAMFDAATRHGAHNVHCKVEDVTWI